MSAWTMPDWMRQFEDLFIETGVLSVEATMGTYGAKAAHKIADRADEEAQVYRAMIVNAQVGLLTALRGRGLLRDVPPCPLAGVVGSSLPDEAPSGPRPPGRAPIVAAAVRAVLPANTAGKLKSTVEGKTHADIYRRVLRSGEIDMDWEREEGFLDAAGNFLSRADAYERAVQCGQIKDDGGTRLLVSEMLVAAKEGGGR